MNNPYQDVARARKAERILRVLEDAAERPLFGNEGERILRALKDEDWIRAAVIAGTHPPSADTREVAIALVAARTAANNRS